MGEDPPSPMSSGTPETPSEAGPSPGPLGILVRLILPVVLLVGGWYGFGKLSEKRAPESVPRAKPRSIEVRVQELKREDYRVTVRAQGEIRAHSRVSLTAQVAGRIQTVYPEFEEGAFSPELVRALRLDAALAP